MRIQYASLKSKPPILRPLMKPVLGQVETELMVPNSVRRRIAVPRRLVVQNTRTVRDTRYQTVRNSTDLEKRVSDIERLVGPTRCSV